MLIERTGQHVRIVPAAAPPPPVEDPLEKERRRVEEEERARAFEEESARQRALEDAGARAAEAKRLEEERLAAPRRYATSLRGCGGAHVYYFDTHGDFQELGKEREATAAAHEASRHMLAEVADRQAARHACTSWLEKDVGRAPTAPHLLRNVTVWE